MLRDITIGQYYPAESTLHVLDPRTKITLSVFFIIAVFLGTGLPSTVFLSLVAILLILLSKVPFQFLIKGLKPLFIILLLTFFLHLFFTPGRTLTTIVFLRITEEGLKQGLLMTFRLVFLILVTSLLTLTTTPINLTDGIERLLRPLKTVGFSPHELAMMMSIALRFIPTLIEETDKIIKAQTSRGADFEQGNLWVKIKNLTTLLVPLLVSSFRRADELAMAMEARCYRGGENRTKMKELCYVKSDYFAYIFGLVVMLITIYLN